MDEVSWEFPNETVLIHISVGSHFSSENWQYTSSTLHNAQTRTLAEKSVQIVKAVK